MNEELVKKVLELARYYPSGDNCQPFRFRLLKKDSVLLVDYIAAEAKHIFAYDDFTLLITLGGALEYIRNAFAVYDVTVSFSLDFSDFDVNQDKPAICSIKCTDTPTLHGATYPKNLLLKRVTDRRPYQSHDTIDIDIAKIQESLQYSECELHINAAPELLDFFALCDSMVWQSPTLGLDIMSAVTFSEPPAFTGLPWQNLGLKKAETYPIRLLQNYPWLFKVFSTLGAGKAMYKSQRELWHSSSSFLLFTYPQSLSMEEKVFANTELMNTMLTLGAQGYSFQPSTMSTDILNYVVKPTNNLQTSAKLELNKMTGTINQVRDKLQIGNKQVNWILRCGKNHESFPENARTLRHPVSVIFKCED